MTISQDELGTRLRGAREALRMTQDQVAMALGVSRSTIAQIELGNRKVTSTELAHLARIYRREVQDLLSTEGDAVAPLVAFFRAEPDLEAPVLREATDRAVTFSRELTSLERLLSIDERRVVPAEYPLGMPRSKWEAIQQGDAVAVQERRRLNLGEAPIWDVREVLEAQGVRCVEEDLPKDVSGLFLWSPELGVCVVVRSQDHVRRRTFSYAHEYCHAVADRARGATVSRDANRNDLLEVRANSFAACFLMPQEGVSSFLRSLGKGAESRSEAVVFDENEALEAQHRERPGSQRIHLYDVVHLAHHFGVSFKSTVYRLKNLRILSENETDALLAREDAAVSLHRELDMALPEESPARARPFMHQLLELALEAYRRELITKRKLVELAAEVDVSEDTIVALLEAAGLAKDAEQGLQDLNLLE